MLYRDDERKISVAMVTNNTLAAGIQQYLQRVGFHWLSLDEDLVGAPRE